MLQVIISPAKQMRAAQDAFEVLGIPPFVHEAARLHRALLDIERNEGSGGLQALWNVSDKLLGPCLNTLHEFGPILKNGDLDNPALARHLSPAVMSYHASNTKAWRPRSWMPHSSTGCKAISGSSRDSMDACAPSTACRPIGSKWEPSSPSTTPVTSMRFGATNLHAPLRRPAPTPRSSTLPAWSTPRPFYPSRRRRHNHHLSLWRRCPQRQAHPAIDRQQKGTRLHGALDGRKQARGCKRAHRVRRWLSSPSRAFK